MPLNRELIGKSYEQVESFEVTAQAAAAYAAATEATSEAYGGDDAMAPPMFGVSYSFGALSAPILDGDLQADLMRLVHGEQRMRFVAPVRPGDVIRSVSTIAAIEEKSSGELLVIGIESKNAAGDTVLEVESGLFIKGSRRKDKSGASAEREAREAAAADFEAAPQLFEKKVTVADDQSLRYAEASGDRNPIHTDDDVAKMAGLPGVILHGLCTMAFAHNALVEHFGGDPMKVERLNVRFSKPVLMGDVLRVDVRGPASGPLSLRVTNQEGEVVLDQGRVELRS
jgi:acyl dehydratase